MARRDGEPPGGGTQQCLGIGDPQAFYRSAGFPVGPAPHVNAHQSGADRTEIRTCLAAAPGLWCYRTLPVQGRNRQAGGQGSAAAGPPEKPPARRGTALATGGPGARCQRPGRSGACRPCHHNPAERWRGARQHQWLVDGRPGPPGRQRPGFCRAHRGRTRPVRCQARCAESRLYCRPFGAGARCVARRDGGCTGGCQGRRGATAAARMPDERCITRPGPGGPARSPLCPPGAAGTVRRRRFSHGPVRARRGGTDPGGRWVRTLAGRGRAGGRRGGHADPCRGASAAGSGLPHHRGPGPGAPGRA